MEERNGFTIKDLLIRLVLIIVFIFLLIWLFPMPDLKPLNNQIFADNLDRMKDVAKSYYTVERLPKDINESKKMTLKEMIENKMILPLMDSNGKYCSEKDSYIQITKLENEYVIKVNLSCTDKQDYIIEHFGCYDICSDKCKMLETTTTTQGTTNKTTNKITKKTTKPVAVFTTKKNGKIYEYEYVKTEYASVFDKYVCPTGYYLVNDSCIKNGSKTVTENAIAKTVDVVSTKTEDAKAVTTSTTKLEDAVCTIQDKTSTIDAGYKKTIADATKTTTTETITATKTTSNDVKAAIATKTTTTASYTVVQNYDIITADKVATGYKWEYVSTITSNDGTLAYVGADSKIELVDTWQERTCNTCASTVTYYKYYKYKKVATGYTYSCAAYSGYSSYDTDKCRKATTKTNTCPSGYTNTGSGCSKTTTTYSCSKYGSDYKLDSSAKTCTKEVVSYSCPSGSSKTSDPKYCTRQKVSYSCPSGYTKEADNTCAKYENFCPSNTSTKTYTLSGSKCTVKAKVKVCSCPKGSVQTDDNLHCAVTNSNTTYTCSAYPGYTLNGNKCTLTTTTKKTTYSCNKGTLNGTTCVWTENTSDTKKAEKTYKIVSEQKYKWSTATSLDGWTYTGNKRQIN